MDKAFTWHIFYFHGHNISCTRHSILPCWTPQGVIFSTPPSAGELFKTGELFLQCHFYFWQMKFKANQWKTRLSPLGQRAIHVVYVLSYPGSYSREGVTIPSAKAVRLAYCAWGERDGGERQTEVTSLWLHKDWRWVHTFRCQKFAPFVSHFSNVHHCCTQEICNELTLSVAKKSHSLFRLSQMARWVIEDRLISLPRPRLLFPSKKNDLCSIYQKTIGNRKRDFAWGCSRW